MKTFTKYALSCLLIVFLASCTSQQRTVKRVSPDQQIDLSGRWNDTDSKMVAEEMTQQVLGERWIGDFKQGHNGERPVVVVGIIKNKSHEHIDAETFIKDIERAIIKNQTVRLVQAGDKREELRGERADQKDFASPATAKKWGQEIGADFIMQGTINSIVDSYKNEQTVTYQINLELTNVETNEIVWIGDKKIKKYVNN